MNIIARTFRELLSTLRIAPESYRAESLCRELVGWLSLVPEHKAMVAFIYQGNLEAYRWYDGVPQFLSFYGIYLSQCEHSSRRGWFIFAELRPLTVSVRQQRASYLEELAA